ncbi:MAG TPA: rhodanese-like domain-containing protein [Acidimicrobiales bacterium]|nr:rhodanese-like domain-containing protein [Acidimicrobiales bacterium]
MPQQASFEAVRAVESGRPAVLAAVSGTSAAFDARERRLIWVDQHETGAWIVAALAAIPLVAVRVARRLLTEPDRFTRGTRVAAGGPVVPVLGAVPPSHRPRLAVLAAIAFAAGLITGPVATLLLVYAENVLDVSSAVTAGLVVAAGLTELAGLMLGRPRRPPRAAADRSPGPDAHGRGGCSHLLRIGAGVGGRASLRGAVRRRLRHIGGCPDGRAVPDLDPLAPEHLPQEQARVPGHIPGAVNIAWSRAANDDGTFRPADELRALYGGEGIDPGRGVITYCRIGERSAHTWFVLHELLGYPSVENYDGSWTEYGSLVGVPVER